MSGLIGKKIGMTSVFSAEGKNIPCTVIEAGPCVVTQVKTPEKDGYAAVQLAYDEVSEKNTSNPLMGHFKKANTTPKRKLVEFTSFEKELNLGDVVTVDIFEDDDWVDVTGISKGKGFQGVVKRHGFGGVGGQTHGQHNRQRKPGSLGASSYPSRVFKGKRLHHRRLTMEIAIYNISGQETGKKAVLKDEIFGIEPNNHAIYLDVKQYLANRRQGTHKSKQRNEVAGSTRKLKKQKGTGGARAGSILSPLFPGGGRVFGPVPRDYSFKLNKKLKQLARKSALTYKAKEDAVKVVEDFSMEAPKTKEFLAVTKNLSLEGQKILLVLPETNPNVALSARNLQNVKVVLASNLNTYDVMNAGKLVLSEGSVNVINQMFGQ